jgi:SAM-dependent methyltransferase
LALNLSGKSEKFNLKAGVKKAYSAAAEKPGGKHPFPVGLAFARSLGYPESILAEMPVSTTESFTGVSNVSVFADISPGMRVLDVGCGAGLDSLIAGRRTGPEGRVTGIDFSDAMLLKAREAAAELGVENTVFRKGEAEKLPLEDSSIDVALVNGLFNLNRDRASIFSELARVVRAQGTLFAAEIVLREVLEDEETRDETNWFA